MTARGDVWSRGYCGLHNPAYPHKSREECHPLCTFYIMIQRQYYWAYMPERYQYAIPLQCDEGHPDRQNFETLAQFKRDAVSLIENGAGLFLFSKNKGNGKTSWACKIANHYIGQVARGRMDMGIVVFISVPDFLRELRANFNAETFSGEVANKIDLIKTAELVIWDDVGTEIPTKWVRETLYQFINHRESNGLSQFYTSNLPLKTLATEEYLGDRIADRIRGQCLPIEFKGISQRGAGAW